MTKKEIFEKLLSRYESCARSLIYEFAGYDLEKELDKLEKEVENYKEIFEKAES